MLVDVKTLRKLDAIAKRYEPFCFEKCTDIPAEYFETVEHLGSEPKKAPWKKINPGKPWGDNWKTAWFRADTALPKECGGKKVFVRARMNARGQTFFFANGKPLGAFDGRHPVVLLTLKGVSRKKYHLAFEAYAGNSFPNTQPDSPPIVINNTSQVFEGIELLVEREDVSAFYFDLITLLSLSKSIDKQSLRYGKLASGLMQVFACVDASPVDRPESQWRPKLARARKVMKPLLAAQNGTSTPEFGVIGNSHIDTAWLWTLAESARKSARTFSSVSNLIDEFPEFQFIQSAPCHADMIREHYPDVLKRMKQMYDKGNWEPNGGMWVEPDANIPSGESFIRQLLIGRQTTREIFGYTGDTLWLPDVFGYSAALPQILKGCGIEFFCTQKISWNDTTRFPFDVFYWQGIDGTAILSHFLTDYVISPSPETLNTAWDKIQHKDMQDRQLCAFGFGDGGGGPTREQIQILRRLKNLEGTPRCSYTTVSDFMSRIRDEVDDIPAYVGELYLEGHRGTLTSIAGIKRGNRKAEIALRNCEFMCTLAALRGISYPAAALKELWKKVLTNQFHDILPGTSIIEVNDTAIATYNKCISDAQNLVCQSVVTLAEPEESCAGRMMCFNTLSWERSGEVILSDVPQNLVPVDASVDWQKYTTVEGNKQIAVTGVSIPPLGSVIIPVKKQSGRNTGGSPFKVTASTVETPFAKIRFDRRSGISSFVDKSSGRQLVEKNKALNTFLLGEDIPWGWDNWDIDRDQAVKLEYCVELVERSTVSNGPLQLRIRSKYRLGDSSRIIQDMVFHATNPQVDFETKIIWKETHQHLKTAFPVTLHVESARHEIQYGYAERPTHSNLPQDLARFEVSQQKWTDISEGGFGIAILNDCKYGVSTENSEIRLSLLKSGAHPDPRGDNGTHYVTYSFLPHEGSFSVENVVRPAYELNIPVIPAPAGPEAVPVDSLITVDNPTVIVETVKWAEEDNAFVVRLYEAGKCSGTVTMKISVPVSSVIETNLLEDPISEIQCKNGSVSFDIRPFEIKTFKCNITPSDL